MDSTSEPIFGSAVRLGQGHPHRPWKLAMTTKVTILSTVNTDPLESGLAEAGRYQQGDLRSRSTAPSSVSVSNHAAPAVPERSPGRQPTATLPQAAPAASIGILSVDRVRPRSPPDSSAPRAQDQPPITTTRHPHTSGSSSASSTRLKAVRTSEESANTHADVVRNFEELIHSDQTIQYTLTPEGMRDVDVSVALSAFLSPRKFG